MRRCLASATGSVRTVETARNVVMSDSVGAVGDAEWAATQTMHRTDSAASA